jgi:hypothetical protein
VTSWRILDVSCHMVAIRAGCFVGVQSQYREAGYLPCTNHRGCAVPAPGRPANCSACKYNNENGKAPAEHGDPLVSSRIGDVTQRSMYHPQRKRRGRGMGIWFNGAILEGSHKMMFRDADTVRDRVSLPLVALFDRSWRCNITAAIEGRPDISRTSRNRRD